MSKLQDLLKCAMCNQTFTGKPILLDCCNVTICEHHIQDNLTTNRKRRLFTCSLCEATHHMTNNKKFAPNKTIENLLEIEIVEEFDFGEIFSQTYDEINNLESSSQKINYLIKDPKNYIFKKISKLKRDVDLRREELKVKIDEISNEMIEKLNSFQQECYYNIDKIKIEEKTKDLVKEIESDLDVWTKDNKRVLLISNDIKRKEIHTKAIELDTKLFNRLKELKEELMMNQNWVYKENKMVKEVFEKELIQFEGLGFNKLNILLEYN